MKPWLEAARHFRMNTDFDVLEAVQEAKEEEDGDVELLELSDLMNVMKAESGGKRTIQALGDKIILGKLLTNLSIPQMPVLFETYTQVERSDVQELVDSIKESKRPGAYEIVVKPTHLSNGTGALVLSKDVWNSQGFGTDKLA